MQAAYHKPHTPVVKNTAAAAALAAAQWTNNSGIINSSVGPPAPAVDEVEGYIEF